jgi:tripartite-type tricarboxylate transporter receptor subunit TctC
MKRTLMSFRSTPLRPLALAAGLLALAPGGAGANEIADFYAGKRLTMVVGAVGGTGAYDAYARLLSRNIVNHLPGAPTVVVQNMPGAGSITAINHVYNVAAQDGTVLLAPNRTAPFMQILGADGARFDSARLHWLGSLYEAIGVLAVSNEAQVNTLAEARERQVILGATSPGTDSVIFPALLNNTLGSRFRIVQGYKGLEEVFLATARGEIGGQQSSLDFFERMQPDWRSRSKILLQFGLRRHPELPDTPLVFDYIDSKWLSAGFSVEEAHTVWRFILTQTTMGFPFAMGPNTPPARVEAMRKAFDAMVNDPRFLAEAAKSQLSVMPVGGQAIEELVKQAAQTPSALLDKIRNAINYRG